MPINRSTTPIEQSFLPSQSCAGPKVLLGHGSGSGRRAVSEEIPAVRKGNDLRVPNLGAIQRQGVIPVPQQGMQQLQGNHELLLEPGVVQVGGLLIREGPPAQPLRDQLDVLQ
jgi:hypothetical protein